MNSVSTEIKASKEEKIKIGDMFEFHDKIFVVIGQHPFYFNAIPRSGGSGGMKVPLWDTSDNIMRWEYLSDILDPKIGFKPIKNCEITITFKS